MENGFTFNFKGADVQALLSSLVPTEYFHVSCFLEVEGDRAIMKTKIEAFAADSSKIGEAQGCPVPPCR